MNKRVPMLKMTKPNPRGGKHSRNHVHAAPAYIGRHRTV